MFSLQELAQICLRIHRILFFGTIYLCGIDPPVLKLHKTETGLSEYISVVEEVVTPKEQVSVSVFLFQGFLLRSNSYLCRGPAHPLSGDRKYTK